MRLLSFPRYGPKTGALLAVNPEPPDPGRDPL